MIGSLTLLGALVIYLGQGQAYQMRWCTISDKEQAKCDDFKYFLNQLGNDPNVTASCVQGGSAIDCMKKIKNGEADLITLDGGEIYRAGKEYMMAPVVAETYSADADSLSYYAVAVVKRNGKITRLEDLKGKKSCHTGAGKTSGWVVPVGTLLAKKLMTQDSSCNPYVSAGKYFEESCVPNVKNPNIDKKETNPKNLCALCEDECEKNGKYSGYSGAFKCLMDGVGEVAFVKHTTVASESSANTSDYLYLCKEGTTRPIGQHVNCNLAKVPSHAVMTKKGSSNKANYASILLKASKDYGNDTGSIFRMFDSAKWNGKDLLFKDSTVKLLDVSSQTYEKFLGDSYLKDLEALNACPPTTSTPTSGTKQNTPHLIGSVVFLLTALFLFGAVPY